MKNAILLFCTVFILLSVQGCSGIRVSQDYDQEYDFSVLETFAWKPDTDNRYGLENNDLVDQRIREAIEKNLVARSYRRVEASVADFMISYNVTVEQKITSSGISGGISIGRSSRGRYGSVGMSSGSQVRAYDQGTLLIDVTLPQEGKLIWRGISTQSVAEHSSPGESTAVINETVKKILAQFPPR